ncbi:MAG TPA: histidine kinase dimerization/phosphoacceptor domain -containing protein [Gemmatimonas sp.]|uniref:sensor histidine kinase n=1 Tax=Gemmatimonas sp. TaxID=1962908 RepID=UPI002EDB4433
MSLYARIFEFIPDAVLVVGADGHIRQANPQAATMFGLSIHDLQSRLVDDLIPGRFGRGHARHREAYLSGPRMRPMGAGLELHAVRADGREFPVDVLLSPMDDDNGLVVLCVIRDVTERRKADQRLRDSLREKEILLREIHHRVKNNLAVISSLLYMQSTRVADPETIAVLEESQRRVRSMALVHETLYRSGNLSSVEFAEYAASLCEEVRHSQRIPGQSIEFDLALAPITMAVDLAVPCGLILNELVTNAMKHAFPEGRPGLIHLTLANQEPGWCEMTVADDGVGANLGGSDRHSLGLTLVESLTRQIDGEFQLTQGLPGTVARLRIPIPHAA